jgi:hypothetical protein
MKSYGFGWCKGVDKNGNPLGGELDRGVFSKLSSRAKRQGPVHIIAIRTMDMLRERGFIHEQGARSIAQWMFDNGITFHICFTGDTNAVAAEFARLGGQLCWPRDPWGGV